jgi:hypothetical protein
LILKWERNYFVLLHTGLYLDVLKLIFVTRNPEIVAIKILFKQEFMRGNFYPFKGKCNISENLLEISMKECDVAS